MRTALGLRSACFTVEYKNGGFLFQVKGYGHGVGMSQYGAVGFALEEGWSYAQILTHYYSLKPSSKYKLVKPVWD